MPYGQPRPPILGYGGESGRAMQTQEGLGVCGGLQSLARLRLRSVFSSTWVFVIAGAVRPAVPTGGPPYPHAPYGAGRGNYDAFRGQGGYPGKPRNR